MGTMVPMISPDGQSGDIPAERVQDAVNAGFKTAVVMTSPDGQGGYIPHDRAMDAIKAGFKIGQPIVQEEAQPKQEGFGSAVASDLGNAALAIGKTVAMGPMYQSYQASKNAFDELKRKYQTGQTSAEAADAQRQAQGRSVPYRVAANVNQALGVNVQGMEQAADRGDSGGIIGHAVAGAVPYVAPIAIKEAAPFVTSGARAGLEAGKAVTQPIADALPGSEAKQARIIQALIPEAKSLPPKAISGVEDVFMASAPTSTKVGFRNNLYVAAPDLADIARKVELSDSAGGIKNPDMRVRATTDAIKSHLDEMYQQERAPQIQRAAAVPVNMNLGADAIEGLKYMKRSGANAEVRAIAASALEEGMISMADADKLAIPTNSMLRGFEAMTPAERAQAAMASRRLESLKALDVGLSKEMNTKLQAVGEPGLYDYERRYAALSQIKQQLERRTNAVELAQPGLIKGVVKPVGNVVRAMTGSPAGITSASQAAVADVNIGRRLQNGFQKLKDSGVTRSATSNPVE